MLRLDREAIDTFKDVTGVSEEATAIQKLQENLGDLNDAILAHFGGDGNLVAFHYAPHKDSIGVFNALSVECQTPSSSMCPSARYSITCAGEHGTGESSKGSEPSSPTSSDKNDYNDADMEEILQAAIYEAPEQDTVILSRSSYEDLLNDINDTEENMIQAAIETSKNDVMLREAQELEYALALSLQTSHVRGG